ncbi:MAG: phage head closure protein [Parvibaculaceae bacterium]
MRITRLDRRLVLEEAERAPDGTGGWTVAWSTVATLWAAVEFLRGGERLIAEALTAEATHRVILRARSDVTPAMRFREGSRVLDILAVEQEERRWTRCFCRERPAS